LVLPFGTNPDIAAEFCDFTLSGNVDRLEAELLLLYAKKGILMVSKRSHLRASEMAWLERAIGSLTAMPLAEHLKRLCEDVDEVDRSREVEGS
jgi:hypothetical protein